MKECSTCFRCYPDSSSFCPTDDSKLTTTLAGEPLLDGRYQLRRRLGEGGMGVVYEARHIFLKTTHAIKVILRDLIGGDPKFLTRFRQEAMAAAAIHHHNVIAVTDYGVTNDSTPYLVMEFIQGKSLQDLLDEKRRLVPELALEIMQAVGAGVAAAHRRGIVHRDLKPLNIMVEDDLPMHEAVKVLDFGIAKIKSADLLGSFVAAKTTELMGSPFYMAPEQWSDEEPEKSADIYSLGIILYQMLAGDVPFKGPSAPVVMRKHLMDEPPRFSELRVAVPAAVEEVVRRALKKEPEQRPASVEDFVNELRDAVNASKTSPTMLAVAPKESLAVEAGKNSLPEADLVDRQMSIQTVIRIPHPGAAPEVAKRPLRWRLIGGTVAVVALISAITVVIYRSASSSVSNNQSPVTTTPTGEPTPLTPSSDQILIPGGTFQMGRDDLKKSNEYPAHEVTVNSFYIDKTEVTNAEYAECVRAKACAVPRDDSEGSGEKVSQYWTPWDSATPPAGQESWPVRNVSVRDAETFAAWRSSKSDGVQYRLPTEKEWEYAARGGGKARLYPWGNDWEDKRANMERGEIEPVGSYPEGRTEQGVEDMIGNVWEWTSSVASLYKGNRLKVEEERKNHVVIRGGSSRTLVAGEKAVTATSRQWVKPETKDPLLGFRLVGDAPEE